jgi:2-polyprenyl-3-methyl-5-hydroxy-6-metoxy-1,4-benzoquinol methylase
MWHGNGVRQAFVERRHAAPAAPPRINDSRRLPPLEVVSREDWLETFCRGKSVLHLGCADALYTEARLRTPARLLHFRLARVAKRLVGFDNSAPDLEKLRARWPSWEFVLGDVEHMEENAFPAPFDVILAGEIIEHIVNPGLFLRSARRHLAPGAGRLVITTPNHFSSRRYLHFLAGREKCHPHHTCYYSYHTLSRLLAMCGYGVERALGYSTASSGGLWERLVHAAVETLPSRLIGPHACDGLIAVARPV